FSRRPMERSSSTVTSRPRRSRAATRWCPMKPAPPVTRARLPWVPSVMRVRHSSAVDLVVGGDDAALDVGAGGQRGAGEQQALAHGHGVLDARAVHEHGTLDARAG